MKKLQKSLLLPLIIVSALLLGGCYADNINDLSTYKFQFPVPFHSVHAYRAAPDTSYDFTNLYKYKEYRDNADRVKKAEILHFNYWLDDLIYRNVNNYSEILAFAIEPGTNNKVSYLLTHVDSLALRQAASINKMIDLDPLIQKDGNGVPITKDVQIEFEFIRFYLIFAEKVHPGVSDESENLSDWKMERENGNIKSYLLGEFKDVNLKNAFRYPANADAESNKYHIEWVPEATAKIISEALKDKPQFYIRTDYSIVKGQTTPKYYFPFVSARYDLVIRFEVKL